MTRPPLFRIFARFLRLGLTAFGGPAMVPYIRAMAVDREGWLGEDAFRLGMGVCQLIPGATAMQMAAYVGLRARGGPGALAAYLGFGLPAFLLMAGLSEFYFSAHGTPAVAAAFGGLQLVVIALILHAAINFARRYLDTLAAKLLASLAGIWLGLGGDPIPALAAICVLALFVCRDEAGGAAVAEVPPVAGRPLLSALVFLAGLLLFLGLLALASPKLLDLGALMVKIDCFAYGGGYVSVPLMLHEVVEARGWLTGAQFMDGIALGQVTPGPIVMTGAFVGYAVAGLAGAVAATVAVFSPSLIFLCAAAPFADRLIRSPLARRALRGSLVSLVGLMAAVAARFLVSVHWGPAEIAVGLAAFVALRRGVDVLWVILAGAAVSALLL
ncbi:chromate efflux transporter [Pseudodesulfovibrio sp.]|uniref:chromate efflux transporter n=1 Tax=Pseudodesulfovibrio sp. TaxID=2035812 RepID=UPI002616828F|nr:chromate efflux transporter [Pseudodesulfovibrio sp.]MDD3311676.1 chromate efflux transporter [Pseudodesulfovibrio sp.]